MKEVLEDIIIPFHRIFDSNTEPESRKVLKKHWITIDNDKNNKKHYFLLSITFAMTWTIILSTPSPYSVYRAGVCQYQF